MAQERHFILGAAGHVDHGKTALIQALTGTNTDRLKEEQERGISIELGFAELRLDDGIVLGVVDMPGHERFVKQMVSGAGGVDLALLVIAADESVMPQTIEHLQILDSLAVRSGVVVLSKIDLVDEDLVEVSAAEAEDLVAGTVLEGKPVIPVSAVSGAGVEALREALTAEARALPPRLESGPFRLPVDRVFSLPGAGAVVTGTCWSGSVRAGDQLVVEPGGREVRVRETQVHGHHADMARSGQRVALALHGVKKEDLERGDQVITAGSGKVTRRVDLRIDLFPHYSGTLKNRQRLHVNHAGREVLGRVVLLDAEELHADAIRSGLCQLHLEEAIIARAGDRLVLRFYSPVTTIAGGTLLDVAPRRHRRFDEAVLAALLVREEGDPAALFRQELRTAGLEGLARKKVGEQADDETAATVGDRVYDREILAAEAAGIAELVQKYADRYPMRLGISKEEVRRRRKYPGKANEWNTLCQALAPLGGWVVVGDRIAATPEGPPLEPQLATAVTAREEALRAVGLAWPGTAAFTEAQPPLPEDRGREVSEGDILRYLADRDRAVQIASDYFVHAASLARLAADLRAFFAENDALEFARFRELSGLTRKLGIPMLEWLDGAGYTRREGDIRRAGPALAAKDATSG